MPIYEYKCKACDREFEYQQRMADPDRTDCEACGKPELERLISRTAFQLKGSGWYKDLYSSSKPDSKSSGETASTTSSSDAGGSASASASTPSSGGSGDGGSSSGSSSGSSGTSGTSGGSSSTKAAAGAS